MAADYAFRLGYELALCAMVLALGLGPGTVLARVCKLPAYCWLLVTFGAACALSYGVFWIYFFDSGAGRLAAIVCWFASVVLFVWELLRTDAAGRRPAAAMLRDRDAWLPGVLMLLLTAAYLSLLLVRGAPLDSYVRQMPPDNAIPALLANRIDPPVPQIGPRPRFLIADWLSSDRPPLQSAVLLAVRPFASHRYPDLTSQAVGTICQIGWVVALYALARQLRLTTRQTAYVLIGCACSGFFLCNTVYVWPKLLAAWLFVGALTLILHVVLDRRPTLPLALVIAALLALSVLSHGGALFTVLVLPVLCVSYRCWPVVTRGQAIAAAALAIVFLAPWMMYQRVYDPPGNRLVKGHLAGFGAIDDRGTLEAIVEEYGKRTIGWHLAARWANVEQQVRIDARGPTETWSDWIRRQQFFHHLATLDALALGFIGLAWRRRSRTPEAAAALTHVRRLLLYTIAAMALWCVLMFNPGTAIVHQGSYAVTMLLFFCAAVGLAELPRVVRVPALAAHLLLFAMLWLAPSDMSAVSAAMLWENAPTLLAAVLLLAFVASLRALPRSPDG
jgi:hypothetical protein